MGNVSSGRDDEEGTSGVKKNGIEVDEENSNTDPMLHSPAHITRWGYPTPMLSPQNPMASLTIPGETCQAQNEKRAAMILWSHGGKEVAVTGSWDNWKTIETLHPLNKDFIITKVLPPGIYHYRFIVDEKMTYDHELPFQCDHTGMAYNILDWQNEPNGSSSTSRRQNEASGFSSNTRRQVEIRYMTPRSLYSGGQEFTPDRLAEFESPPSPISSYDNEPLNDGDFIKYPPDLPPQLQMTILNEPSSTTGTDQYRPVPNHTTLNHLYIQNNDGSQPVALGVTHRIGNKYVTVIIYKATSR